MAAKGGEGPHGFATEFENFMGRLTPRDPEGMHNFLGFGSIEISMFLHLCGKRSDLVHRRGPPCKRVQRCPCDHLQVS